MKCIAASARDCSRAPISRRCASNYGISVVQFARERRIPLVYRGLRVGEYIPDLIVENTVVVEIKSVAHLEPVFTAQLLTYLRITGLHVGLLLNFNAPKLVDGLKRVVL